MASLVSKTAQKNVDEYIRSFPANVRKQQKDLRTLIKKLVPDAEELISYGIPAYKHHGILIYFAAFKNHISIYPAPRGNKDYSELEQYEGGKGTVRFPLDKPIPLHLVKKVVQFRKKENELKLALKKTAARKKPTRTK